MKMPELIFKDFFAVGQSDDLEHPNTGAKLIPVATQGGRKGTKIFYHLEGSQEIYWAYDNADSQGRYRMIPFGYDHVTMRKYYDVFVQPPFTPEDLMYCAINRVTFLE